MPYPAAEPYACTLDPLAQYTLAAADDHAASKTAAADVAGSVAAESRQHMSVFCYCQANMHAAAAGVIVAVGWMSADWVPADDSVWAHTTGAVHRQTAVAVDRPCQEDMCSTCVYCCLFGKRMFPDLAMCIFDVSPDRQPSCGKAVLAARQA